MSSASDLLGRPWSGERGSFVWKEVGGQPEDNILTLTPPLQEEWSGRDDSVAGTIASLVTGSLQGVAKGDGRRPASSWVI